MTEILFARSLFAAVAYGFASMAMVFINKAVLMQYAYSMTLLTLQVLTLITKITDFRPFGYLFSLLFAGFLIVTAFLFFSNWLPLCLSMLVDEWDSQRLEDWKWQRPSDFSRFQFSIMPMLLLLWPV